VYYKEQKDCRIGRSRANSFLQLMN
jgi:hypothetical protein